MSIFSINYCVTEVLNMAYRYFLTHMATEFFY